MNKKIDFLYLSEEDMVKAGVLNMHKCVEVMEETFNLVGNGDYLMGGPSENVHGIRIFFPKKKRFPNMPVAGADRRFMAMVGYLGGRFNVCGLKWYGSNVENPLKRGYPRSILMTILNDPVTAQPLAIMSANLISAMRTGAIPGLSAKYLAKKDSKVIGVIGGGVISKACLMSLIDVLKNVKKVKIYDIVKIKAEEYSRKMSEKLGVDVYPVNTMEEAVKDSDVVNVATAGEKLPFIKSEWLKDGSMLSLPAGIELEEEFILNSKVVVDEWKMHIAVLEELKAAGLLDDNTSILRECATKYLFKFINEGKMKNEDIISLSQVVAGKQQVRINNKQRTVMIMAGLPVEDISWSYTIYKNALKMGIGQKLTLWNEPTWF